MLRTKKKITFSGESVIGDKVVCIFSATIECDDPKKTTISQFQRDKDAYTEHRAECRADFAAFEDAVLAKQAEMLKTMTPIE